MRGINALAIVQEVVAVPWNALFIDERIEGLVTECELRPESSADW